MDAKTRIGLIALFRFVCEIPAGVSVDMNGLAQCSGFTGMVTIEATAPMDPNMPLSKMTMMTMNVTGMAQLTCP
ncbi:MAG TPA: hypothetical protein VGR76_20490 [Candidatus Angelobacter sp.]|nr:hypothetical protein [Candidatus Angelobacter sp.]